MHVIAVLYDNCIHYYSRYDNCVCYYCAQQKGLVSASPQPGKIYSCVHMRQAKKAGVQ
jgi:hypothetical protein